jgi:hypothetical protein
MDWLELLSSTIHALIWAAAVVLIVYILRREIETVLGSDRLRRLKAGTSGLEIEFERDLEKAEKQLPSAPGEVLKELPSADAEQLARDFLTEMNDLAAVSPRSVVLESHARLERLLRRCWAADQGDRDFDTPVSMRTLGRFAMSKGYLNPAEVDVLNALNDLRNRVVHHGETVIAPESARRYAALALDLAVSIRSNTGQAALPGAEL